MHHPSANHADIGGIVYLTVQCQKIVIVYMQYIRYSSECLCVVATMN